MDVTVNGRQHHLDGVPPYANLLDWLRGEGLIGAKEGCAEGECGACAVLVARPDGDGTRWTALNSCLPPALALDGQEIITAEGLGQAPDVVTEADLHPVQREMADRGGSQCGYCTPGFVSAMADEYYRPERRACGSNGEASPCGKDPATCGPNGFDLHALSGNLCRCTGYRPIRDAAFALDGPDEEDSLAQRRKAPTPPARRTRQSIEGATFQRPADLTELLEQYGEHPDAVLVAGATDHGVDVNIRAVRPQLVLAIDRIDQMRHLDRAADHYEIGAALTLSEIERELAEEIPVLGELLPQFASRLIRNSATLGGNIGTASPIGDAAPVLLALDASLVLAERGGEREVPLVQYFTGYRQTVRRSGELIKAIRIPRPLPQQTAFYKIAKRRFDDISSVAVAIGMDLDGEAGHETVSAVRIGLGGVAATPMRAAAAESMLLGQRWDAERAILAASAMASEGTPMNDHRASARYRSAMLEQALLRFFAQTTPSEVLS